jgi:nucleotide-binding universal stress UspA family protein
MENITVGLDDEDASQTAVDWVIDRARSKPVRIRLVTAFDMLASNPMAAQQQLARTRRRILDAVSAVVVETVLADRSIMEELIEQSASADLLVIGSHPHHRIRSALTGSFPVGLAARSRCAIVIVPDDWTGQDGAIVVGVAADHSSDAAAMFAAREAVDQNRELEVLHAWEPWKSPRVGRAKIERARILEAAIDRVREAFPAVRARGILVEADPSDAVVRGSRAAHLVVLGTHRLGAVTGLLLGATGQHVMHRAGVALCIVPLVDPVDTHARRDPVLANAVL